MTLRDFLQLWGLQGLELSLGLLGGPFVPNEPDRAAAWDLYIELVTRITTQDLPPDAGDEQAALDSVHQLFPLTREALKKHGPGASQFAKVAIPVLNQIIRPFTAKWHRLALSRAFESAQMCEQFRSELATLRATLRNYTRALAAIAGVEELTSSESGDELS